ncbi:hypothetical protein ELE36_03860 [Pseudolysobacter antarcticus]|uniref:Flippase-like domain-containing protein n=1 Tax=Pseudolysobacter antarcticus TaxID=2511995 RepID=A0A411HGH1_9GAMM|nr:hypothetical protein [Pseudolysobacter antarcticus]QBB69583.1 hypothetical protein ELE36_03860 [Pseudolysobacter antarcticus]
MTEDFVSADRSSSSLVWKFAAGIVTIASLVWVAWLLVKVWPDIVEHGTQILLVPLLIGFALSLVASYLTFEAFATLVRILGISRMPRRELAHLHFTAQLLKHLPGRVWGVGYQWAAGSAAGSLGDWLWVNLAHMLLATFFALWSSSLALGFSHGLKWGALTAVIGMMGYVVGWLIVSSHRLSSWLTLLPGRFGKLSSGISATLEKAPASARVKVFLLFSVSWLFYYASWFMNGMAYPPLGPNAAMQLCAYYMLAWFVGYLSLLTPSGLGVRELVFAWLAKDFPGDAVAIMALVGRVGSLAVDLVLGLAFAPFVPRKL